MITAAAMFLPGLPALGQAIANQILGDEEIGRYIRLGLKAVTELANADQELSVLNDEIQRMVDEGRQPSDDEWKKYDDMIDDALARARAAAGQP